MTKILTGLAIVMTGLSVWAQDAQLKMDGQFVLPHEVPVFSYASKKECQKNHGQWLDDLCTVKTEDTVKIQSQGNGKFSVSILTVGSNFHSCSYNGEATVANQVQLLSEQPTTQYVFDPNTQDAKAIPTTCSVRIQFQNPNTLSVFSSGNCDELCGVSGTFDTEGLYRK